LGRRPLIVETIWNYSILLFFVISGIVYSKPLSKPFKGKVIVGKYNDNNENKNFINQI